MSQMVQHGQTQAAAVPLPEPKFILPPGAVVMIGEEEYQVERRLPDGRCQLLSVAEGIPLFQTDRQLADRQLRGEFYVAAERGLRIFAPPPLSPIAIGDKAHEKNLRKHAYVQHCLDEVYPLVLSRQRLVPVIEGCAAARGEEAPAFTTVLSWLKEWQRYGEVYGTAAYSDRHDLKGRFGGRMLDHQERAIEYGIDQWLKLGKKVLAYDLVVDHVRKFDEERGPLLDKASLGPVYVDSKGRLIPPSKRTFERRCALLDPMVRDWAMKGPAFARKHHRTYQTRALPDRPYQEVEVDDCTLDILVIDPSGLVLGRPNLIVFRDRATGMILGYSLSFEGPSYASFVQGLKHAMYPKSLEAYPQVKNAWPCWGRIENLFLDNALHFLGDNIRAAARELGFNLVHCAPRQPWLKGAVERIFETAGTGFIHSLPGTTLQNVIARRDHENLGEATLTLDELGQLLTLWICDIYHARVQKGLGPIRGVGDVPLQVWADKAKDYRTPLLPHEDVFMSLAGDVEERTIQKDGISWDYIKYESADLWALLRHPEHKRGRGATKYKVVRNPYDLGQISVIDPYNS
ncbi:MAG: Mu transposase C-terminal domain-containing protein, partial [Isosphaeraceae bacterium]